MLVTIGLRENIKGPKSGQGQWADLDTLAITALITHRNKTRFGFSAELEINRQDFGVNYSELTDNGGLVVSNKVTIEIDGEAIKQ